MNEQEKLEHIKKTFDVTVDGDIYSKKTKNKMSFQIDKDGYKKFRFWIGRRPFKIFVHRLVALLYIENPNNYPVINHIDGNKQNNHTNNLEWCTVKHNTLHAQKLGLRTHKYLWKKVKQIDINTNEVICVYNSITEASKLTGISRQYIGKVSTGQGKSAGGYKWKMCND
jgi:hypothetical protein